jgi:hypothetical protein
MSGNTPYSDQGLASLQTDAIAGIDELFSGNTPSVVTRNYGVASGLAIAAFAVVGLAEDGTLTPAIRGSGDPDDDIHPIGITTAPVLNVSAAQSVDIFMAGCFNPAALVWPASYTTDAQKAAAFDGASTPTNILIRPFK